MPRESNNGPFTFPHRVAVKKETEGAILVSFQSPAGHTVDEWVPKSCIHDDSPVWENGQAGVLIVVEYFADAKGWIDGKPKEKPQLSKCKSCGAAIRWGKTPAGRNVPIDVKPTMQDGRPVYLSHFQTCPNASQHSRRGR
jgi:hypothetical protein